MTLRSRLLAPLAGDPLSLAVLTSSCGSYFRWTLQPAYDYPYTVEMDDSTWNAASSSGVYVWNANYPVRPGSSLCLNPPPLL